MQQVWFMTIKFGLLEAKMKILLKFTQGKRNFKSEEHIGFSRCSQNLHFENCRSKIFTFSLSSFATKVFLKQGCGIFGII